MYKLIKRIIDLLGALFLLLLLLPLLLLISITIKFTSKGPIIFKQKRIGLSGVVFDIYKFRTMIENAENTGTGLNSYDDDPRVTKVGAFLRNSSLDELPQLINILNGAMSFVGPRPPVTYSPYAYAEYPMPAINRFDIKPGVTGWAQVNGRNELSWDEKFYFDLIYLKKVSFTFDLKIILLTALKVIKNEGAFDKGSKNE